MGETGCGKTRLVKFLCALQTPKLDVATTMIIMKVSFVIVLKYDPSFLNHVAHFFCSINNWSCDVLSEYIYANFLLHGWKLYESHLGVSVVMWTKLFTNTVIGTWRHKSWWHSEESARCWDVSQGDKEECAARWNRGAAHLHSAVLWRG